MRYNLLSTDRGWNHCNSANAFKLLQNTGRVCNAIAYNGTPIMLWLSRGDLPKKSSCAFLSDKRSALRSQRDHCGKIIAWGAINNEWHHKRAPMFCSNLKSRANFFFLPTFNRNGHNIYLISKHWYLKQRTALGCPPRPNIFPTGTNTLPLAQHREGQANICISDCLVHILGQEGHVIQLMAWFWILIEKHFFPCSDL